MVITKSIKPLRFYNLSAIPWDRSFLYWMLLWWGLLIFSLLSIFFHGYSDAIGVWLIALGMTAWVRHLSIKKERAESALKYYYKELDKINPYKEKYKDDAYVIGLLKKEELDIWRKIKKQWEIFKNNAWEIPNKED